MNAFPDTAPVAADPDATDLAALRAEVADLRARVESYERILQLHDAALAAAPPAPAAAPPPPSPDLPHHFEIAADQLLPAQDGFYQLEWGPEGAFRWTGPSEEVGFDAWVDRSRPLVATLRLFHLGTPANANSLAIEVDGVAYPLTRDGKDKLLRSDPIQPRSSDGPTRLTLRVPHMHSPAARGAADRRVLGVAFQRLRIEPA
ncbi:hypothetical protein [Roseomonas fluvialis]|uniref:hypothetical protein n=1 Tax=Roseomonas fluvialis TaxID=1750527 RepID=UPI001FCE0F6D|nr:hypothetical protein [Roseomonas fluvialis]